MSQLVTDRWKDLPSTGTAGELYETILLQFRLKGKFWSAGCSSHHRSAVSREHSIVNRENACVPSSPSSRVHPRKFNRATMENPKGPSVAGALFRVALRRLPHRATAHVMFQCRCRSSACATFSLRLPSAGSSPSPRFLDRIPRR